MKFFDYNKRKDFLSYLRSGNFFNEQASASFVKKGETIFELADYDGYKKAIFFNFLYYIVGKTKVVEVVIERLFKIKNEDSYFPTIYDNFIKVWLGEEGELPEYREFYDSKIKDRMVSLNQFVSKRADSFIASVKNSFEEFYTNVEGDLFLEEMEIHSDELRDKKLSEKALRWEFKYLGRDEKVRQQRREIYLKRQDECLK